MNILATLVQLRDDLKSWVSLNFEALNKKIDKKSRARFSRDYYDLYNAPQITEDDKKELSIADEQGNVIFKLDKDGAHTTNLTLNGEEAASQKYVQEAIESIDFPETDLTGYDTEEFVEKAIETEADIISCSALLTTTMLEMSRVVEVAVEKGVRDRIKIMIGGAPVTQKFCDEIGADGYTTDAVSAAEMALELVK